MKKSLYACAFASVLVASTVAQTTQFSDVSASRGLNGLHGYRTSVVDINGDSYPDIFASSLEHKPFLYVYNPATQTYDDVTASSGVAQDRRSGTSRFCSAAVFCDIDNDGDLDMISILYHFAMYSTSQPMKVDRNEVLVNTLAETGSLRFELAAAPLLTDEVERVSDVTSAVFCDYDLDGIGDLFLGNALGPHIDSAKIISIDEILYIAYNRDLVWVLETYPQTIILRDTTLIREGAMWDTPQSCRLLRGTGNSNQAFVDVTQSAGIGSLPVCALAVAATDINNDGLVDLFAPSYLNTASTSITSSAKHSSVWLNAGNGTFTNAKDTWNYDINRGWDRRTSSFGTMARDFNGDGYDDLLELIVHGDSYQANSTASPTVYAHTQIVYNTGSALDWLTGYQNFADRYAFDGHPIVPGIGHYDLYGAATDFDADGRPDVLLSDSKNITDGMSRLFLFQQGASGTFTVVNNQAGMGMLLDGSLPVQNVTPLDYDCDGDEDILVGLMSDGLRLLQNNRTSANSWVKVKLTGAAGVNRMAAGAVVEVRAGSLYGKQTVRCGDGHLCPQRPSELVFGLGVTTAPVCTVSVSWPDRARTFAEYLCPINEVLSACASDAPPVAPTRLRAEWAGHSSVYLQWTDNARGTVRYAVERLDTKKGTGFTCIATLPAGTTSFTDENAKRPNFLQYRIRAASNLIHLSNNSGEIYSADGSESASSNVADIEGNVRCQSGSKPAKTLRNSLRRHIAVAIRGTAKSCR